MVDTGTGGGPGGNTGGSTDTAGTGGWGGRVGAAGAGGSGSLAGAGGSTGTGGLAGATGSGGSAGGAMGGTGAPACSPSCAPSAYCSVGTCKSRFTEYSIGSDPGYITSGADGHLWFTTGVDTSIVGGVVGRLTVGGTPTLFPILATNPNNLTVVSVGIVQGPDDNIWFDAVSSDGKGYIGQVTATGAVTNYQFSMNDPQVGRVAVGPDGNIWAAVMDLNPSEGSNRVEICTLGGSISEKTLPGYSSPYGIVAGSDGNVWLTETALPGDVARMSLAGSVTEFPVSSTSRNIAVGADGNLWFTEPNGGNIGRYTPGGTLVEFPVPPTSSSPSDLTEGPDGTIWFTEGAGNNIGSITTSGKIIEYATPATPYGITAGPDGNIWFTEPSAGKIVRFIVP